MACPTNTTPCGDTSEINPSVLADIGRLGFLGLCPITTPPPPEFDEAVTLTGRYHGFGGIVWNSRPNLANFRMYRTGTLNVKGTQFPSRNYDALGVMTFLNRWTPYGASPQADRQVNIITDDMGIGWGFLSPTDGWQTSQGAALTETTATGRLVASALAWDQSTGSLTGLIDPVTMLAEFIAALNTLTPTDRAPIYAMGADGTPVFQSEAGQNSARNQRYTELSADKFRFNGVAHYYFGFLGYHQVELTARRFRTSSSTNECLRRVRRNLSDNSWLELSCVFTNWNALNHEVEFTNYPINAFLGDIYLYRNELHLQHACCPSSIAP